MSVSFDAGLLKFKETGLGELTICYDDDQIGYVNENDDGGMDDEGEVVLETYTGTKDAQANGGMTMNFAGEWVIGNAAGGDRDGKTLKSVGKRFLDSGPMTDYPKPWMHSLAKGDFVTSERINNLTNSPAQRNNNPLGSSITVHVTNPPEKPAKDSPAGRIIEFIEERMREKLIANTLPAGLLKVAEAQAIARKRILDTLSEGELTCDLKFHSAEPDREVRVVEMQPDGSEDVIFEVRSSSQQRTVIEGAKIESGTLKVGKDITFDHCTVNYPEPPEFVVPALQFTIEGPPLNQPIKNPAKLNGILITEAGRAEDGSMYVIAQCAETNRTHRLTPSDFERDDGDVVERLTAERDNALKLFDVANRLNQERATQISEMKAQLAKLTKEPTEVECVQPAEVGAMGRPRSASGYRW